MDMKQLKEHFGTQAAAAKALGITFRAVSAWNRSGIPMGRQYQIQLVTGGILQADMAQEMSQKPEAA